jgi:hypothetical protein
MAGIHGANHHCARGYFPSFSRQRRPSDAPAEAPGESPRRDGNGFAPVPRAYETRAAARGGIPKEGDGSTLLRIFDDNCRADDAQIRASES